MSKALTRNVYLVSLLLLIVSTVLIYSKVSPAVGGLLYIVGAIGAFVAWVGALIKTAQLSRWGWFVGVLITGGIGLLIYVFGGPTEKR